MLMLLHYAIYTNSTLAVAISNEEPCSVSEERNPSSPNGAFIVKCLEAHTHQGKVDQNEHESVEIIKVV